MWNRNFFEEALDAIPSPVNGDIDASRIEALLSKVTSSMQLQIRCLTEQPDSNEKILHKDPNRTTVI